MKEGWTYKKLGEVCQSDLGKTLNQSKDTGALRVSFAIGSYVTQLSTWLMM